MTYFPRSLSGFLRQCVVSLFTALAVIGLYSPFAVAHWADLSVADVVVGETTAQMTLTVPTNVVDFADSDSDGELSQDEFLAQRSALLTLLQDKVSLVDDSQSSGEVSIDLQAPLTQCRRLPTVLSPCNIAGQPPSKRYRCAMTCFPWTHRMRSVW